MTIQIVVTNTMVGRARFYEQPKQRGNYRMVPTYRVDVSVEDVPVFIFSVTRDVIGQIFEVTDPHQECPPSRPAHPYSAYVRTDNKRGFRLQLYEQGIGNSIRGQWEDNRSVIQIHRGPGQSAGCMLIAGGKRGHQRFTSKIKQLMRDTKKISVVVHPR